MCSMECNACGCGCHRQPTETWTMPTDPHICELKLAVASLNDQVRALSEKVKELEREKYKHRNVCTICLELAGNPCPHGVDSA